MITGELPVQTRPGADFVSVNPATGQEMQRFDSWSWDQLDGALDGARTAFAAWSRRSLGERAQLICTVAAVLRDDAEQMARLMTAEMGKTYVEACAEVAKCVAAAEWIAGRAASVLAPEAVTGGAEGCSVAYRPLGVVLAVMPWNYPLWQVFRAAVPALVAGNVVVLKHAPNVTGSALAIEDVFRRAGDELGVLRTALVDTDLTARAIGDRRIAGVTLTGSVAAGRAVGAVAGRHIKPAVLELGGSDPFIVLADADIALAARSASRARMQNNGQTCIAAKRFIVVADVAERFIEAFVAEVAALRVGDPMDPTTDVGPLARRDLRDTLQAQLDASLAAGATVATGGQVIERPGWWFTPTVLTDVTPEMPVFAEETFGPLAGILVVADVDDAVRAANHTDLGLGCSVWTADVVAGAALSTSLEAGMVFVNRIVASDPRLPFGGVKDSGLGRELGDLGIRSFTNVQTLSVGQMQP